MLLVGVECDHFHGLKTTQEKHKPNREILQQGAARSPHLQGVLILFFNISQ